jgi:hypothetical protein
MKRTNCLEQITLAWPNEIHRRPGLTQLHFLYAKRNQVRFLLSSRFFFGRLHLLVKKTFSQVRRTNLYPWKR